MKQLSRAGGGGNGGQRQCCSLSTLVNVGPLKGHLEVFALQSVGAT